MIHKSNYKKVSYHDIPSVRFLLSPNKPVVATFYKLCILPGFMQIYLYSPFLTKKVACHSHVLDFAFYPLEISPHGNRDN